MLFRVLSLLSAAVLFAISVEAQGPPTPEELTLRPGDTITWTTQAPPSVHRLRFGGSVTHNGQQLNLTTFDNAKKILDLDQNLTVDGNGIARGTPGVKVTGKVRADAPTSGVS